VTHVLKLLSYYINLVTSQRLFHFNQRIVYVTKLQEYSQRNAMQHNTTQHNTTQHNATQQTITQHNATNHNTTQHNTTQHNTTQHNTTQQTITQHITTQHNMASQPRRSRHEHKRRIKIFPKCYDSFLFSSLLFSSNRYFIINT
jgi:hypothetical protein